MAASSPARGRCPTAPEMQRADPRRPHNSRTLTVDLHELAMLVERRAAGIQRAHQTMGGASGRTRQEDTMAKLALIVIISTALMTGVAADPQNDGGLVAPELSRPTPGQLLRQDYITGSGATVD